MSICRKYVVPTVCCALFLSLAQAAAGTPAAEGTTAVPRVMERQIPLAWSTAREVRLQPVDAAWQTIARLQFLPASGRPAAARRDFSQVSTGPLSWTVTAEGTQVLDNRSGSSASIPNLTSAEVRPHDIAYDKQTESVWFYGETVYRYRIASRTLERLRLSGQDWHAIRKIGMGHAGLWLAAGNGIYLLDADGVLKKARHPAADDVRMTNMAAGTEDAWFATADARLIRIERSASGRFELTASHALPGVPAELAAAGQTLWLLLGDKHGDHYRLAFVGERPDQLGIMAGKYYSLTERDGHLTAGAYSTVFSVDPLNKTATPVRPVEAGLLAHAARNQSVLYAGSSYGYKDGCEVVEHGQLDISKGWLTAMGDPLFR